MGIPATGRTINVGIFDNFRVADGQLAEHWGVLDTGALMQQLTGG
jgi:predicted ester cyclase